MKNNYIVYRHTSPSGKVYIGITGADPRKRWQNGLGYRRNEYFFRAILKYGWDNFTHEILHEGLTKAEACSREIELIAQFGSTDPAKGYNLAPGGEHATPTRETLLKRSASLRGKHLSAETRAKISAAGRGRRPSEATRKKLSEARRGHVVTKETRAKIAATKSHKMISITCVETGVTYESISSASRATGISQGNLSACIKGSRSQASGFHWRVASP